MTAERPPRCRARPAHLVGAVAPADAARADPRRGDRRVRARAARPAAERAAVVAAHGYAEGPVGAAMELDAEIAKADALARRGLELLRCALADLDD